MDWYPCVETIRQIVSLYIAWLVVPHTSARPARGPSSQILCIVIIDKTSDTYSTCPAHVLQDFYIADHYIYHAASAPASTFLQRCTRYPTHILYTLYTK